MKTLQVLFLAGLLGGSALAEEFSVAVVPSDDRQLAQPAARDAELSADQVAAMVRRAVDLVGGMKGVVADTAKLVLIKPNISVAEPSGSGIVTDARVVRGVALLVHEAAPGARILIAEGGGGWRSPAPTDLQGQPLQVDPPRWGRRRLRDGFEIGGYRQVVTELRAQGVDIDCFDLNFDQAYTLEVPGGGMADPNYDIATAIMDADAWINCPVTKTHGSKITCSLKNQFGILPGTIYGWSKSNGTNKHAGMPHLPAVIDEFMVDLWLTTSMDLNVVDGITGHEAGALQEGEPLRNNLVLAGRDPVATDLVVARLLGFNPDDMEFADLAFQRGKGPGRYEKVKVKGAKVETLIRRFKKAGSAYRGGDDGGWDEWKYQAEYGMGPRRLILLPAPSPEQQFSESERAKLAPEPGKEGWSELTWFGHDRLDLANKLAVERPAAVYAFSCFVMPKADSVRFWAGSEEGLQVWIDGREVYNYQGARPHHLGQDQLPGYLEAGEHRLLARVQVGEGAGEFSFNICEPLDDPDFAGNRYPGLRYYVDKKP
ncbi:MAG: DUF362 domain-containing protein [Candidatus Latescibacteria bacterium]|nr:DUF362 domain-containing protein [Candidatus Latescibacterota bacterium]